MYKTDLVTLAPLEKGDSKKLFEWINDKDLVHFNNTYRPIVWENHQSWFSQIIKQNDLVIFALKNSNNILIGTCQLHSINLIDRTAELQIRIGDSNAQSKGIGTDAIKLLLDYGWKELNLNKIYLYVFDDNYRAKSAYLKTGFIQEGLLKHHAFINGEFKDIQIMSIFKPLNLG